MKKVDERPILVCLTATRNYGWCTKAFLEANSLWADYIIVVDQMSTDNTREICAEYDKVIVVDNTNLTYSETIRCNLAINKACEIKGDKIFIYLAIDEVLSANAIHSKDWKIMLETNPSDVGCLQWANICSNGVTYHPTTMKDGSPFWMARIFHDDMITPYNSNCIDMHTNCIPYPKNAREFYINDFVILHLEQYNTLWLNDKIKYYHFVDYDQTSRSAIRLDRKYNYNRNNQPDIPLRTEWLQYDFDLFNYIDLSRQSFFFEQIKLFIEINGVERYVKLNVWKDDLLNYLKISDPRSLLVRSIHNYLDYTRYKKNQLFYRIIDWFLSYII